MLRNEYFPTAILSVSPLLCNPHKQVISRCQPLLEPQHRALGVAACYYMCTVFMFPSSLGYWNRSVRISPSRRQQLSSLGCARCSQPPDVATYGRKHKAIVRTNPAAGHTRRCHGLQFLSHSRKETRFATPTPRFIACATTNRGFRVVPQRSKMAAARLTMKMLPLPL